MQSITLELKTEIESRVSTIAKKYESVKLNNLSDGQLEEIAKRNLLNRLESDYDKEVEKLKINSKLDELKNRWLNQFDSKHTKKSFEINLDLFITWLNGKSIAEVDSQVVDDYSIYLKSSKVNGSKKIISNNTLLQRLASPSSFFKSLLRWDVVSVNYFLGVNKPKKKIQIKTAESVPTDIDLDKLESYAKDCMSAKLNHKTNQERKRNAGKYAYAALKIIRESALRVGALVTLQIDENGYYTGDSKGGQVQGQFSKDILDMLKELSLNRKQPFKDYSTDAFSKWFYRASKGQFSVHGIRHYAAIRFYKRTKDIMALKEFLQHGSVLATQSYLATLKSQFGG